MQPVTGTAGLVADTAAGSFSDRYGGPPDGVWSAPGRVNLIGEHTDYNEGLVLPFAIAERTAVAARRRSDQRMAVSSALFPGHVVMELADIAPGAITGWPAYPLGVAWALARAAGRPDLPGAELLIDSRVPLGAGLSSSAALECAVACALNELWDLRADRRDLAHAGQQAENSIVGTPTGLMDQYASLHGETGCAVFLDCRTEETRAVPLRLAQAGLQLIIIDTKEHHAHATGGYAARRASCERAARILGVRALRDLSPADLARAATALDAEDFRRVRHVVTENERVSTVAALLAVGQPAAIGPQLTASHQSMRDDFEISTPALDLAVEAALRSGALGSRMTGGGFGGAAIALIRPADTPELTRSLARAFAAAGLAPPAVQVTSPGPGARRDR